MNDDLLSRIAEALFWTGRYVERADDTARLVDVYVHRTLGDPGTGSASVGAALFAILGVNPPRAETGPAAGLDAGLALARLAYDGKSPSAITGALFAARSGARGIREIISSEMWQCLNVTGQELSRQRRAAERLGPHVFLRFVSERAALFFGLADATMSHDDAWRFLVLGRCLERADMTARLLLARLSAPQDLGWAVLLRACGAYESFIRTRGWAAETSRVAEFLLLDQLFPRSVLHSLVTAEDCLIALNPGPVDPARRPVGRVRTALEYADPHQLPGQLPDLLSTLQLACVEACEAITSQYFKYEAQVAWERG